MVVLVLHYVLVTAHEPALVRVLDLFVGPEYKDTLCGTIQSLLYYQRL